MLRAGLRVLWSALANPRLFGPFRLRVEPNSITVATAVVGIGNRLVAIASARGLAREHSKSGVNLIWIADSDIAYCRFSDLFELTTDDTRVVVDRTVGASLLLFYLRESLRKIRVYKQNSFVFTMLRLLRWVGYLLTRANFDKVFHISDMSWAIHGGIPWQAAAQFRRLKPELGNRTLVYSHELFHGKPRFDFCKPRPHIQRRVDEIADRFGEYTVGVHIRLEDYVGKWIEEASPVELFIQRMTAELERNDKVKFFLATDSGHARELMTEHFKDRVITLDGSLALARTERSGMENAVVDMFTLARTDKILAPYLSTFSRCAAMIGKTEFEVVLNNSILNQVYKEDLAPALRAFEDSQWC